MVAQLTKKPRKRKKHGGGTLKTKTHAKNRQGIGGHEERQPALIKRTLQLRRDGYTYQEVAEMIQEEFQLEVTPHFTTIHKWRNQGMEAVTTDMKEIAMSLRMEQFHDCEKMLKKWMPIATAQHLEIKRWVRVEGELQPELDENAVEEQIKATQEVVKIMARQAKLMGLDLEKTLTKESGEGMNPQELQIWLINAVNNQAADAAKPVQGQVIEEPMEVLELTSGIPEVDAV